MRFADSVWALLETAKAAYPDAHHRIAQLQEAMAGPLKIAVHGQPKSGKSTLLDAIVGTPFTGRTKSLQVDWPGEVVLIDEPTTADAHLVLLPRPTQPYPPALDPVAAIAVLSRADELGGGRLDAMVSARQIARRHAKGDLGALCQDVVAVSGLAGVAAATMRPHETNAFATLAAATDRRTLDAALISVDRFTGPLLDAILPATERQALLTRFGLFGVRWCVSTARRIDTTALAQELRQASGVEKLWTTVTDAFVAHADTLKARSALHAVSALSRTDPRPGVAAEVERVTASAHDLKEVRLRADLRTGRVSLAELGEDAGKAALAALEGLEADPYAAMVRWRAWSLDGTLSDGQRRAAAVLSRTCAARTGGRR